MVLRGREKQKRLLSQVGNSVVDFTLGQDGENNRVENWANISGENATSSESNNLAPVKGSQQDIQTTKRSFPDSVCNEVSRAVATVETIATDANIVALDSLVLPRVELALRPVSQFSRQNLVSVVLDTYQREF